MNIKVLVLLGIVLLSVHSKSKYGNTDQYNDFKMVAYFPVNADIEDMDEIDFSKLTHVIGAFIQSDISGNLKYPGWKYDPNKTSQEAEEEMLDSLIKKSKRAGCTPMIALGTTYDGWQMTKDPTARSNFVSNIKALIEEKELGGIDLDLEGWANSSATPFYSEEYALLAMELRDSLGDDLIMTSAVSANESHVKNWTDDFISVLNWVNIMVYDIRVWNPVNIANQSLFSDQVAAAEFWEDRGLNRDQIVFGVPFYSRGWDYDNQKPYTVDVCWSPKLTADSSTWTWNKISTFTYEMLFNKFTLFPDQDSILVTPNDQMWEEDGWTAYKGTYNGVLYFNGQDLLKKKTAWAIDSGYGGMMIWELAGDLATEDSRSLLGAMVDILEQKVSINTINNSIKSSFKLSIKNQRINISSLSESYNLSIVDMRGREIINSKLRGNQSIPICKLNLSNGSYIIEIKSNNNKHITSNKFLRYN